MNTALNVGRFLTIIKEPNRMKRPTDKMVHFATAIYNAGFTPSDGQSIDEIIDDFDLCYQFIGCFKDSFLSRTKETREESKTKVWLEHRQDDIHSNRYHGEVEISPLMKAAWEYETEIMKEYFGPESLWRWDGL